MAIYRTRTFSNWITGRQLLAFGLLLALAMSGCGEGRPTRVKVSGQVLIDGVPLGHGFVQVIPENDRAATGTLGPDGRFTLTTFDPGDGCVPGKHTVTVIANETLNPQSQRWHAPKKYIDPTTSNLHAEVSGPTDSLLIELSWGGGAPFVERFDAE